MKLKTFNQSNLDFQTQFNDFLDQRKVNAKFDLSLHQSVCNILEEVKNEGYVAIYKLTQKFDCWLPQSPKDLFFSPTDFKKAFDNLEAETKKALTEAYQRITQYHQSQKIESFSQTDQLGNVVGQITTPIEKVGIYVPGGSAAYPSSVLMNAIPAKIAGVKNLVMAVPTPNNSINPLVLAAAHLCGVSKAYKLGGAVAIAALSFGVKDDENPIEAVDKIVGPGNKYVAEAKRQVFGQVGIDMIAGPSELTVICDETANLKWVCLDLFAQAEHDELASSIAICTSQLVLDDLKKEIDEQIKTQPRQEIIKKSLTNFGALIKVNDIQSAFDLANQIAPEHLELSLKDAKKYVGLVKNAGAIFVGHFSAEVYGDYCAGPSHVLPTSGSARFFSALGVYDFLKRTSVIECSEKGSSKLAEISAIIAQKEGLFAHRDSALVRKKS